MDKHQLDLEMLHKPNTRIVRCALCKLPWPCYEARALALRNAIARKPV
jgi:hypothetical protein